MEFWRTNKKHDCTLNLGSDSMLPKKFDKFDLCRTLRKLTLIAVHHPETTQDFISYPAILAERQRSIIEGGAWVIHPYSLFSLIWRSFMVIIDVHLMLCTPLRFCYVLPTPVNKHHDIDNFIIALKSIAVIDIFMRFNTGYRSKKEKYIVMVRRRIAFWYLSGWFCVDLISCLPIGFLSFYVDVSTRWLLLMKLLPCVRCAKVYLVIKDFKTFVKVLNFNFIFLRVALLCIEFLILLHWCCCLMYLVPMIEYYWEGEPPLGYSRFLLNRDEVLNSRTIYERYQKAAHISLAAFFGTSFSTFRATRAGEMITNAIVIICGQVFMLYFMAVVMKIYEIKFNSSMRYQELMNQVEKYMQHKRFPVQMKNRVRDFYKYRYQEKYFRESLTVDCLSEQIRNEISLDTCRKLIEIVTLFEGLPASVVGSVVACLHSEVYLPDDLVTRAGDIGDCMYFIACGTVAVYSLKGAEVCHLDDGAHFGEVALLMKDRKRIATVVALEITQVYRLDQADFRDFIMSYQELYERVEVLASKRMHETVVIDEAYKLRRQTV